MEVRVEVGVERYRDRRDVGLWAHDLERHENAVVEAALQFQVGLDSGVVEEIAGPRRKLRRTGRGPGDLVGLGGKAGVVVDQVGGRGCGDAHRVRLPVGGRDEQRRRRLGSAGIRPASHALSDSHVSGGDHSMKKQGPPPCGM